MTIRDLVKKTIEAEGYRQADVAEQIRYSHASLASYLGGKYGAGVSKIESALATWLRKHGALLEGGEEAARERYIETRCSATVIDACSSAQEEGLLAAIIGPPGAGKTIGLTEWQRQARKEKLVHVSVAADVTTSYVALIRKISRALGLGDTRPAAVLLELTKDHLARTPALIIVDEAQHLGVRALEAVRSIHDATGVGVVLAGSLTLSRTLEHEGDSGYELAQLQDRIAIFEKVALLSPAEISAFAAAWWGGPVAQLGDAEALAELRTLSRGVPRRLVRILSHCRRLGDGKSVSGALVREAAKRLVAQAA
ncbi:MAG TPA: AAA family ATPase [Gaiellaceae bacterium]|nr:AAA family ATPase [Gaiellaceae bacterium]